MCSVAPEDFLKDFCGSPYPSSRVSRCSGGILWWPPAMDYFNVEHMGAVQPSCRQGRCASLTVQRILVFVVAFSTFFLFCEFSLKLFLRQNGSAAPSNTQNSTSSQLRRMAAPGSTDRKAMLANTLDTAARGFVLAWNEPRGFLLLKCDRKTDKGVHFQLPGGHVDSSLDIKATAATLAATQHTQTGTAASPEIGGHPASDPSETFQTEDLARTAAARELWEETGIDVRTDLQRLVSLSGLGVGPLHKNRYYFFLNVTDSLMDHAAKLAIADVENSTRATGKSPAVAADPAHTKLSQHRAAAAPDQAPSPSKHKGTPNRESNAPSQIEAVHPQRVLLRDERVATSGSQIMGVPPGHVRPSVLLPIGIAEHSGFQFEADPHIAAELVKKHSGGYSSIALLQFYRAVVSSPPGALAARRINVRFH